MQCWLLAMFWTHCSCLQNEANASKGRGWGGWRKKQHKRWGRQLHNRETTDLGTGEAMSLAMTWWGFMLSWEQPGELLEASPLPCWVCRQFERGRFGRAPKPLPPFMLGAACKEKLSFFPRVCRTSFAGPACCGAKVCHERVCNVSACCCSWFVGRMQAGSSKAICTVLASCRNIYFSQRAVTVQHCRVIGHLWSTISNGGYGAISKAELLKERCFISLFFFFPCMLSYLGLLMLALL